MMPFRSKFGVEGILEGVDCEKSLTSSKGRDISQGHLPEPHSGFPPKNTSEGSQAVPGGWSQSQIYGKSVPRNGLSGDKLDSDQ